MNLDLALSFDEIRPMAWRHDCSLHFSLPPSFLCLFTLHAILLFFFSSPLCHPCPFLAFYPSVSVLLLCNCLSLPHLPLINFLNLRLPSTVLSSIHPTIHPCLFVCRLASRQSSTSPLHSVAQSLLLRVSCSAILQPPETPKRRDLNFPRCPTLFFPSRSDCPCLWSCPFLSPFCTSVNM